MKDNRCFTIGGIAVVKVGIAGAEHHVHGALLIQHPNCFSNALKGP